MGAQERNAFHAAASTTSPVVVQVLFAARRKITPATPLKRAA
jgi:hypothetical protein